MRIKKTEVFKFAELSDAAKEKAREWYRSGALDYDWWDFIYDDAATIAGLIGIDLFTNVVKKRGPQIYFSGFCSQGDGACFFGSYRYAAGSVATVKSHAPQDKELHRIVEGLHDCQRRAFYGITATIEHRGHYNHSGCMSFDFDCERKFDENEVKQLLRDFADWIYGQLEKEHDWLTSDEQVDESITANEYEFLEDGSID